jgi:hypothetical protein
MKNFKILAILAVLAIYATLFFLVINFVDAANAGLHMQP